MISGRTDKFSRVVAFITAFAIAMLTVTLVHRSVISAEETHGEISGSYNDPDTAVGESASPESDPETSAPIGSEDDIPVQETTENIYGSEVIDGNAADSVIPEDDTIFPDANDFFADDSGIALYESSGDVQITPWKTPYPANSIINPAVCKIYKGGKQELIPGEHINDGDPLEFDFEWSIPDNIKDSNGENVGFTDKYLEYDITDKLKGIELTTGAFSWWTENEGVKAVYEIRQVPDPEEAGKFKTLMLIEPRIGFEADSTHRSGSIHLYGKAKLSDFDEGKTEVTLEFIEAKATVTAPSLDNSITPAKATVGQPEKRVENGVTKYYQKYRVTLTNNGIHEAKGVTALDVPGSILIGVPQNVYISYSDSWEKVPLEMKESAPYTFDAGNIKGGGEAYIEYEMEVDAQAALSTLPNSSSLKNRVTVTSNPNPDEKTSEVSMDVSSIRPSVNKSGVLDKENRKITWTITVYSKGMGDSDFTVTDTIDSNLVLPADYNGGWTKADFVSKGDGIWEKTYETELPETVTNKQVFNNKAVVTYPNDYVCEGSASVAYVYDNEFVKKECTGLGADGEIGWTAAIDVPKHLGGNVTKIVISDGEVDGDKTKYGGNPVSNSVLMFETDGMTITVDGRTVRANSVGAFDYSWNNYTGGFVLTVNDNDFLNNIAGKTITLNYTTKLIEKYKDKPTDIEQLGLATNSVTATVYYSTGDDLQHSDTAEYRAEFVIRKETGYHESEVNVGALREPMYWLVTLTDFSNVSGGSRITFSDTLPEGYTFRLDDKIPGTEYYIKCGFYDSGWGLHNESPINVTVNDFNGDYSVMNGTVTLTEDQANKMMNEGYFIRIMYFTQMTEEYYSDFNSLNEPQDFKNQISASVNSVTRDSEWTQVRTPKNNMVLDKTSSGRKNNDTVTYTLTVNSEGVHLGNSEANVITLTDTLGKYLSYNNALTISPQLPGDTCSYDKDSRKLTLKLRNEQAYTITYTVKVLTLLNYMEYDEDDGIDDDDRDLAIINMLYGNTAELSFPGGAPVKTQELIKSEIYRSEVYIKSKFANYDREGNGTDDPEVMYLKIKKNWDDTGNPADTDGDGKIEHNESVKIKIMKFYEGGTAPINANVVSLDIHKYNNEENEYDGRDYYKIIKELPIKDKDGRRYTYKIVGEENMPPNYVWEADEMTEAAGGDVILKNGAPLPTYIINLTNTYGDDEEKTNITVNKAWSGDSGSTSNRSKSVDFIVTQDGEPCKTGTLSAANGWKQSFDLPKYSDEAKTTEHIYEVYETTQNPYYIPVVTSAANADGKGSTFTITNKYLGQTVISVTKEWKNDTDHTDLRSAYVDFTVFQNGKPYETGKLSAEDGWTKSLKVPKYSDADNKVPYVYSVNEVTENQYYDSEVRSADGKTFTIENTFIPREKIKIKVTKVWKDDDGHEDLRSDSVDFTIVKNDRVSYDYELNAADGWSREFEMLKYFDNAQTKLNSYRVTENTKNLNYTSKVESTVEEDGTLLFTIINTFDPTDITITKHWTGEDNTDARTAAEVTLWRNGVKYGVYTITGGNDSDTWSYTVRDLPKYDKNGNRYSYTVSEKNIDGYTLLTPVVNPTIDNNYQASLTNKYSTTIDPNEKITVTVTKHWSDEGHRNDRTDVEFDLLRNGVKLGKTHTIVKAGKTEDNWQYTIDDLPKYDDNGDLYTYTVAEKPIKGYTSKVTMNPIEDNGYNAVISNEYVPPETVSIPVTKRWDDEGYKYKRTDIMLKLMQDGTEYKNHLISAEDNVEYDVWTYTFKDVPKYDVSGNAYVYTVEEETIGEYTSTVTKDAGNGWSITNKYNVPTEKEEPGAANPGKPTPAPDDNTTETEPTPGTDPAEGTRPVNPPSETGPAPVFFTTTALKEPEPQEETEDVSSEAGVFDEEFDAIRRDDMLILILVGVIITGTLILAIRHNSDKSDGKYHM